MQKMKSLRKARSELDDERTDGRRTAGSQMAAVQVRIRQRQRTDGIRVSDELDLIVVIGQQSGDVKHCSSLLFLPIQSKRKRTFAQNLHPDRRTFV